MGGPGRVVEIGLISFGTSTQVTTSGADLDTIWWNNVCEISIRLVTSEPV